MDLNFEIFQVVLLLLAILVVGNFLRDGSSNYLEGGLLVVCWRYEVSKEGLKLTFVMQIVYIIIGVTAWYYPNADLTTSNGRSSTETSGDEAKMIAHGVRMLMP